LVITGPNSLKFKALQEPEMPQGQGSERSGTSKRGFASMDPDRQREIARKGGASVPSEKRSFSQDRSLAAEAGRKGGEASHGGRKRTNQQRTDRQT
jgi:general stress protein YciG